MWITLGLCVLGICKGTFGCIWPSLRKEVCYNDDGIGCFNNTKPYDNAMCKVPESPSNIQVKFVLYTRPNTTSPQTEDANVFTVNWSKGADIIDYYQASANTRVVGALIAQFITQLRTTARAQYGDFHLIGHSLGSHIAGYAGERISGLGRITGLDPAGFLFEKKDPKVRLDPTDAVFVDAIHTDGKPLSKLGFGLEQPVGHVDYFPNGGENQPGCGELVDTVTACSHMRVLDLFIESINSNCTFRSYPCSSRADFQAGKCNKCGTGCANMGYNSNSQRPRNGTYYLSTNGKKSILQRLSDAMTKDLATKAE